MRKPDFCICENKAADQLRGYPAADQHLCFCFIDVTIPLNSKLLAIFCGCIAWFVLDLVENPEGWFSHEAAHMSFDLQDDTISVAFTLTKAVKQLNKIKNIISNSDIQYFFSKVILAIYLTSKEFFGQFSQFHAGIY